MTRPPFPTAHERRLIRGPCRTVLLFWVLIFPALATGPLQKADTGESADRMLRVPAQPKNYRRSEGRYTPGDFEPRDHHGNKVSLHEALANDQGVLLDFIFTGCTTLCPLMSASFAAVQAKLGTECHGLRLISISIDPDHDSLQRLDRYRRRFGAGPQWQLLGPRSEDVIAIQKAFGVYRGAKTGHSSVIFLKGSQDGVWVRLEGYPSASDILAEYGRLRGHRRSRCP